MPEQESTAQDQQIEAWLSQMTMPEKVRMLTGEDTWSTVALPRLGIPGVSCTDGPHGVRADQLGSKRLEGPTTSYPTGISMAATWDRDLIHTLGQALAEETRTMGCDVLLGPCVNIMRTPLGGRNFESFSEDPYLAGEIALQWVLGLQSKGVASTLKHFACNDQEVERMRVNIVADERTLREIHLAPFEKIVRQAKPWAMMCSYPRLNGAYCSENSWLLQQTLRDDWAYKGMVISDWTAVHSTTDSINNGVDLEMPGPPRWRGTLLEEAVNLWLVEESVLDDAVRRVLRFVLQCLPAREMPILAETDTPEHRALARQVAREAITLLKNEEQTLPIPPSVKRIAVIGLNASQFTAGGGSSQVFGPYWVSPLDGLRAVLGEEVEIVYEAGADNRVLPELITMDWFTQADGRQGLAASLYKNYDFQGDAFRKIVPALNSWWASEGPADGIIDPHSFSGIWEGIYRAGASGETQFFLSNNGLAKLYIDEQLLLENDIGDVFPQYGNFGPITASASIPMQAGRSYHLRVSYQLDTRDAFSFLQLGHLPPFVPADGLERAVEAAKNADMAIIFAGNPLNYEREGFDRPNMRLPGEQDKLISAVAAVNQKTTVVISAGAPVEMPWADEVPAIAWSYYAGQEGGNAIAEILTGKLSPSGKLPVSLPKRYEDNPTFSSYPGGRELVYEEGIFVGYRYYDTQQIAPLFPFGHGLSYAAFAYRDLQMPASIKRGEALELNFVIRNTGSMAADEVVQIYVHENAPVVRRPEQELKGFTRVSLQPGEEKRVTLRLDADAFLFFDETTHCWTATPGSFEIRVAGSSRDIRLRGQLQLV